MRRARRWRLWLSEGAERTILEVAAAHHPDEAGGVLLGVLAERRPWVTEAIGVPSARPSCGYYELPAGAGHRVLARARRADSRLGYLGEWHSHPADVGPSQTDRRSMAALAVDAEAGCPRPVLILARRRGKGYRLDARQQTGSRLHELRPIAAGPLPAPSRGRSPKPRGRR